MKTSTILLIAAVVIGSGVYIATRDGKAALKKEIKKTTPTTGGDAPKPTIIEPPPFPGKSLTEESRVEQIYDEWVAAGIDADAAAIKSGLLTLDVRVSELTDEAFYFTYPEAESFPDGWAISSDIKWANWSIAWHRMKTQMFNKVSLMLASVQVP